MPGPSAIQDEDYHAVSVKPVTTISIHQLKHMPLHKTFKSSLFFT